MVRVSVCEHDDIDILRFVSGGHQSCRQLSRRKPFAELFIFAWKRAVAGIKQHHLFAGVNKGRNIGMLKPLGIDVIGAGERLHFIGRGVGAIVGMQSLADCLGIENGRDLKPTKLEAVNSRLQFTL